MLLFLVMLFSIPLRSTPFDMFIWANHTCKSMPSKCGRIRVIIQLILCCCMWLFALILYFASVIYSQRSKIGVILFGFVSLLLFVSRQICCMRLRIPTSYILHKFALHGNWQSRTHEMKRCTFICIVSNVFDFYMEY